MIFLIVNKFNLSNPVEFWHFLIQENLEWFFIVFGRIYIVTSIESSAKAHRTPVRVYNIIGALF